MKPYLGAHDQFVDWLGALQEAPQPSEIDNRLQSLAVTAAASGMTSTHRTFVVDGLVAHVNRIRPGDILLSSYVARGFDLVGRWREIEIEAALEEVGNGNARRARRSARQG
jgi:RNA-binding protein YlmH